MNKCINIRHKNQPRFPPVYSLVPSQNCVIFYHQGKELATSVVSNVKHALGLKEKKPTNKVQCTREYWSKTVEVVGTHYGLNQKVIDQAIINYKEYAPDESA